MTIYIFGNKNLDFNRLTWITNGFTFKEMVDLCRDVSFLHLKDILQINKDKKIEDLVNNEEFKNKIRTPITINDFERVMMALGLMADMNRAKKELDLEDDWDM